jgi:hypothetical protein
MFKNRVPSKILWPKREEVRGDWENCTRSFTICNAHQMFFGLSKKGGEDEQGMWHKQERRDKHIAFRWGNLKRETT